MRGGRERSLGFVSNLALMLSSVLFCLVLAEIVLAFVVPPPIIWLDPQETYVRDADLMHRLTPNQTSFTHSFPVHTNSYGLRDDEFPLLPDVNTFRIICLGDSLTFGNGVRFEDAWPKQLQAILNRQEGSSRVQVINAGVSAYDTWQEIDYLEKYGIEFRPKVVIVGFYANDVVPKPLVMPIILSSVEEPGSLKREGWKGLLSDEVVHLLKRSRTLLFLQDRIGKLTNFVRSSSQYSHKEAMLLGLPHPFIEEGWKQVDMSLRKLQQLSESHGFQVLLVVFPMEDQIVGQYGSDGYQVRLRRIVENIGIPVVDLMPAFRSAVDGFGSLFIEWDGHPNARAYGIAAEEVRRALIALLQKKKA